MGLAELLPIASWLGLGAAIAWWAVYAYGSGGPAKDADQEITAAHPKPALSPLLGHPVAKDDEATAVFSDKLLGEDGHGIVIDRD